LYRIVGRRDQLRVQITIGAFEPPNARRVRSSAGLSTGRHSRAKNPPTPPAVIIVIFIDTLPL
jgi:hypothetical protein